MDTLPDLRVTIAESMEALAHSAVTSSWGFDRWMTYLNGAETLRWSAAREAPSIEDLQVGLAAAQLEAAENEHTIEDLVANVRFAVSKWEHGDECPAGQLEARGDAVCNCALVERRQSVLDAVA